ncbi:beta-1,6-N-acetylglucosaminyltransferase [Bacteroidales bacterium OttesenSCG-928-L03]|nr:beta-1,6-N-acetylglucosaminyltransferase [Bacteroidales bacterium OttesenSCG-928-L03]
MQAAIITSYKDFHQLFCLTEELLHMHFKVFIHVDKKSFDKNNEYLIKLSNYPQQVHLVSTYSINWGSINHLYAIIDLIKEALKDKDIHFIHILSSQDYPIKHGGEFDSFFSPTNTNIYMTLCSEENFSRKVKNRYSQYYFFSELDSRRFFVRTTERISRNLQKAMGIKRTQFGGFNSLCKGMVWLSAPQEVFDYVISTCDKQPSFLRFLNRCKIPEEFFFQTILSNSSYAEKIVPDNLRFTVWEKKHNSIPAILDETDFPLIKNSEAFFVRKIDSIISHDLTKKINDFLLV